MHLSDGANTVLLLASTPERQRVEPAMEASLYSPLKHYSTLHFGGADMCSFLQGQLSNDIDRIDETGWQWSALHLPDGRVFALLLLIAKGDELIGCLPASVAGAVCERLRMFRLRAKVDIEMASAKVFGVIGDPGATKHPIKIGNELSVALADDGDFTATAAMTLAPENAWALQRLRAGIVELSPDTQGRYVGQMLNLDLLPAISFSKGCFIGQEILARTQNLGRIKRRAYRFKSQQDCQTGDRLMLADKTGERAAGEVIDVVPAEDGVEFLAVVQQKEKNAALTVHDTALTRLPLPYESD